MEIFEHSEITLSNLTWTEAVLSITPDNTETQLAPGFANTPEDWKTQIEAMGLDPNQIILSATHSHVAYRHVKFVEGESRYFLKDATDTSQSYIPRGWHIITETNLLLATWASGGSSITIQRNEDDSELFDVVGKFPIESDGHRYEGFYYETMMQPVYQANAVQRFETLAAERKDMFDTLMMKIIDETGIAALPGFQDWEGPVDPASFREVAGQFEVYTEEQEITIDEKPVKALVFVGASGWDEWYRYQRDELVSKYPGVEFPEYESLVWGVCQVA
jgi:hypothetical protein